jgi:hypothetical protein
VVAIRRTGPAGVASVSPRKAQSRQVNGGAASGQQDSLAAAAGGSQEGVATVCAAPGGALGGQQRRGSVAAGVSGPEGIMTGNPAVLA